MLLVVLVFILEQTLQMVMYQHFQAYLLLVVVMEALKMVQILHTAQVVLAEVEEEVVVVPTPQEQEEQEMLDHIHQ